MKVGRLTRNQRIELAAIANNSFWGISDDIDGKAGHSRRTRESLLRRKLITKRIVDYPRFSAVCEYLLTDTGRYVIESKTPIEWIRFLQSHNSEIFMPCFITRLSLIELPEFLASGSSVISHFASKRLAELSEGDVKP